MKRLIFLSLVIFFSASGLFAQKKEEKKLIEQQIQLNDNKMAAFYMKGNADSLADLYSPNCTYMAAYSKRFDGRDELQKKFSADFKNGLKILEFSAVADDHKVYGDMVLEIGVLTLKYSSPVTKTTISEMNNYLILWKKSSDGKYRIRSEVRSPINKP